MVILLALILYVMLLLWCVARSPEWAQGLLASTILVIAFGWIGLLAAAVGVATGLALILRHRPPAR